LQMRKPTIIEEMPDHEGRNEAPRVRGDKPEGKSARTPGSRSEQLEPGQRPDGRVRPTPTPEDTPTEGAPPRRVPLGHSRRGA
jgi:hypothetical protein